jgi:hypothetical protein
VRPVFLGRLDAVDDERWNGGLVVPGGAIDLPEGAVVFTLDGRVVGLVVSRPGPERALAPLALLEAAAAAIAAGGPGMDP